MRTALQGDAHHLTRVTGADYVFQVATKPPARLRVALIGATREAGDAFEKLMLRAGHSVVLRDHGRWEDWAALTLSEDLKRANPQVTFVAVSPPNGELLAASLRRLAVPGLIIGVGGAIDMVTGRKRRSPDWVARLKAEWLFRLAQEPRRLATRYLLDCAAIALTGIAPYVLLKRRAHD
ncbi:WecB/TagA/CpsF family glycosyltransferase [Blastococcus sp. SYSU DS0973]